MDSNDKRLKVEKRISDRIVDDALKAGYLVSVFDGGEWTIRRSAKAAEIKAAMRTTDEDVLAFTPAETPSPGSTIGRVWLVYGNGPDVITDYTDNEKVAAILAGAEALAEKLELVA